MSRRNQRNRRRTYGRRQHEVRERRQTGADMEGDGWSKDEHWTGADYDPDHHVPDDGPYGSYLR